MKKFALNFLTVLLLAGTLSSCATVFGGPQTAYQKTPPLPGEPQREIRVGALVADIILFWPGAVIDFATGAIYRPAPRKLYPAANTSSEMNNKGAEISNTSSEIKTEIK